MKVIVIPDSFKGSISSVDACNIIEKAILDDNPNVEIVKIPIADGGEGTVDCFLNITKGKKLYLDTVDLYRNPIRVYVCKYGDTYILELASIVGLTLHNKKRPLIATTYGVGIIINEIIKLNPKKIIIGLGGSGTNDCGIGMAQALGTIFYDNNGNKFNPTITTLNQIAKIDNSIVINKIKDIEIIAMCDVTNPLCGLNGATYVFGPQKGLEPNELQMVDNQLKHLGILFEKNLNSPILDVTGSGAAGGMGAAILGFLNGKLESGIYTILNLINFNTMLKNTDYVITGEGKFDSQSLNGKVISGITNCCKKHNVPVIVVCGTIGDINDSVYTLGIKDIYPINPINESYEDSIKNVKTNLYNTIKKIVNRDFI